VVCESGVHRIYKSPLLAPSVAIPCFREAVKTTEYDINKILRVFWMGAKYAVRDYVDIAGAVYHYNQNNYNSGTCTNGGLSASSCAGTLDAVSAMVDYRVSKRLDMYAGVM
jgi:predicted porin